uniref:Uncharacterized protein n=1 Tax=Sipha flava TaxID=143950 RepID=A0A2S2Q9P4_9HEMI
MDKIVGYDNATCCVNDDNGTRKPSMEMERVVDCRLPTAKCCGTTNDNKHSSSGNKFANAQGTNALPNACLPKCPAVKTSPWDPLKTRIALFLTVAIVIWLLIGVTVQNI